LLAPHSAAKKAAVGTTVRISPIVTMYTGSAGLLTQEHRFSWVLPGSAGFCGVRFLGSVGVLRFFRRGRVF
jgi:hypothetical protein